MADKSKRPDEDEEFVKSLIPAVEIPPAMRFTAMEAQVATLLSQDQTKLRSLEKIEDATKNIPVALAQIETKLDYNIADVNRLSMGKIEHDKTLIAHDTRITILERDIIPEGRAKMDELQKELGLKKDSRERFWSAIMDKCFWPVVGLGGGAILTYAGTHMDVVLKIFSH